ncbi:uncharacterized protein PAC_06752 [Phialocephala subalpina]|uniref:Uncharacterized protein n=1 Tax=Phialocephala subalpina TaxID=576137 RepID=A0A1L7WVU6_9HELO|nr:uncharacterized protein PAC_06752 [Phialocephala subalpina]
MGDRKEGKKGKGKGSRPSNSEPSTKDAAQNPKRVSSRSQNQSETPASPKAKDDLLDRMLAKTKQGSPSSAPSAPLYLSKRDNLTASSLKHSSKPTAKEAAHHPSIFEASSRRDSQRIPSVYPAEKYKSTDEKKKTPAISSRPSSSQTIASDTRSQAPLFAKSIFKSSDDQKMAQRQTKIESMLPEERQKQENWAQGMIKGLCLGYVGWNRIQGGYRCIANQHAVTDELVSEGKGGMFFLDVCNFIGQSRRSMSTLGWKDYFGSYYRDRNTKCYCGCGNPLWKLGDVKDKPKVLPQAHTCNGMPILEGTVYLLDGQRIAKKHLTRWMKEHGEAESGS